MFSSYKAFYEFILSLFPDEPSYYTWSLSTDGKKATYYFYKQSAIVLKLSGKIQHLSIPSSFVENPEAIAPDFVITDSGKTIRFPLDSFNNMIALSVLPSLIKSINISCRKNVRVESFGCCNDFVRCSDAKKCLHPNDYFYLGCLYRDNLDSGKIFYGENAGYEQSI